MKRNSLLLILLVVFAIYNKSNAEESLTIKQQLDRVVEEVKDLNKAVFNKSFDKDKILKNNNEDVEKFASIDLRIYDLEKDIKNLTLQFEEILFKLDDLSVAMDNLENKLITIKDTVEINQNSIEIENKELSNDDDISIKDENTLGKIKLTENNQQLNNIDGSSIDTDEDKNALENEIINLNPEEQLQYALDQMMKKNYDKSKEILESFILNYPDNNLSGSAHFWLGKIYLFQKNYRKAAIVYGEGVQKFPKSIKAAEMYYELAKSLKEMNKINEACKTLDLLDENYKGNKFSKDPEKIRKSLNCQVS